MVHVSSVEKSNPKMSFKIRFEKVKSGIKRHVLVIYHAKQYIWETHFVFDSKKTITTFWIPVSRQPLTADNGS